MCVVAYYVILCIRILDNIFFVRVLLLMHFNFTPILLDEDLIS